MTDHERDQAIKEGHRNAAAEAYLEPRKAFRMQRAQLFAAGFDRGYDAATAPLLAKIAELEAKLAQRVPDYSAFESAVREYIEEYEMLGETEDGCDASYTPNENDKALLLDAFMGFDFSPCLSAAPAAPEQQEPTDSMGIPVSCGKPLCSPGDHHPLCAQAPSRHQGSLL